MKKAILFAAALFVAVASFAQNEYNYQKRSLFEQLPIRGNDIVFLGNSITDGCEWAELFNNRHIKNRGISADRSGWLLDRLDPIVNGHPKKLFLMIGTNDGHVVAAARRAGAETIVTFNLKDFPADELSRYGLHAQSPDVFLTSVFDAHPEEAMDAMRRLVSSKRHPPRTMSEEIEHLRVLRLPLFARRLSETVG